MKVAGSCTVPVSQERAYTLLQDPVVLARCMPYAPVYFDEAVTVVIKALNLEAALEYLHRSAAPHQAGCLNERVPVVEEDRVDQGVSL